jgi:hypothetical protein
MAAIGVDCVFSPDGSVRIRRVQFRGKWKAVSQGRQWLDQHGRHVLIMLSANESREIVFRPDTMAWDLKQGRDNVQLV